MLAPVIAKATAAAGLVLELLVMVMMVEVLDNVSAYQVSSLTWVFGWFDDLTDHFSEGFDVIELTMSPGASATTTYRKSLVLKLVSVIEIVFPVLSADAEPSKAKAGFKSERVYGVPSIVRTVSDPGIVTPALLV